MGAEVAVPLFVGKGVREGEGTSVTEGDGVMVRVWVGVKAAATFVAGMAELVPEGTLDAGVAAVQPSTVRQIAETIPSRMPCQSFRCNCMRPIITSKPTLVNSLATRLKRTRGHPQAETSPGGGEASLKALSAQQSCPRAEPSPGY